MPSLMDHYLKLKIINKSTFYEIFTCPLGKCIGSRPTTYRFLLAIEPFRLQLYVSHLLLVSGQSTELYRRQVLGGVDQFQDDLARPAGSHRLHGQDADGRNMVAVRIN